MEWVFHTNGNANDIYRYIGLDENLKRHLLRVRREKGAEYVPTREVFEFQRKVKVLFPELETQLVPSTWGTDHYALLIPNYLHRATLSQRLSKHCTVHFGDKWLAVELKPKWLYRNKQKNCRNCLLNQVKGYSRHFCPLDLLHPETLDKGLEDLLGDYTDLRDKIRSVLVKPNILHRLRTYQRIDELPFPESPNLVSSDLLLSMALRDAGVFFIFADGETSCHLYDVDLKSPSRLSHWLDTERMLRDVDGQWPSCTTL